MTTRGWHLPGSGILAALCIFGLASGARADGCFVWNRGADLYEPSQKAIIHWHRGTETMVLQVKYEGPAEDFAWIVPLPARPKVSAIKPEKSPFAEISLYTQARRRWGYRGKNGEPTHKVQVLERKVVGVYDVAVLAAADAKALGDWLNKHGYAFPKDRADVLGHYTRKKWVYVAMRIDRKALATDEVKKLKTGELQPIRFSFASTRPVYPLRISCVNAGPTDVLLYLLAAAPVVLKAGPGGDGFDPRLNMPYAFPHPRYMDPKYGTYRKATGDELPLTWNALGLKRDSAWHLCKYRREYRAKDMSDDLSFAAFDPLAYWQRNVRKLSPQYGVEQVTLLAQHDERTYGPLLREIFDRLLASGEVSGRCAVARNPAAPPRLLSRLADDNDASVQGCVAGNPRTPAPALRRLADSHSQGVRYALAGNPSTPPAVLVKLLDDHDSSVVGKVVQHPKLPAKELSARVRTGSAILRRHAAWSDKLDPAILADLAKDKDDSVRAGAGANPRTPPEALATLADDVSYSVRIWVARNPAAPPRSLAALAEEDHVDVAECVARNARTPAAALARLARSDWTEVRYLVAAHPTTPGEVLRKLAQDKNLRVSQTAKRSLGNRKQPARPASRGE